MTIPVIEDGDGTYCLFYKRGDSFPSQFQLVEADGVTPIDITGFSFVMTVDSLKNPPDVSTNLFAVVGIIDDAVTGLFSFAPTEANTDLPVKKYWYDVQRTDASGKKRTSVKDRFVISQDISKG